LDVAAGAVPPRARRIVDLGIGTGALAARCLARAPRAAVVGIDADADMLAAAARRLGSRAAFVVDSFLQAPLPSCDAVVASFALHHVRTRNAKRRLYRRIHSALRPGGVLVVVDCQPSRDSQVAARERDAWTAPMRRAACFRSRLDANRLLILAPDFGDARLPSALMGLRQDPVRPALQLELSGHLGFLRLRERRYRFVSGVTMRVPGRHIVDAGAASI